MWPPREPPPVPLWALWIRFPGRKPWGPDMNAYRVCRELAACDPGGPEAEIVNQFTAFCVAQRLTGEDMPAPKHEATVERILASAWRTVWMNHPVPFTYDLGGYEQCKSMAAAGNARAQHWLDLVTAELVARRLTGE